MNKIKEPKIKKHEHNRNSLRSAGKSPVSFKIAGSFMGGADSLPSISRNFTNFKHSIPNYSKSSLPTVFSIGKLVMPFQLIFSNQCPLFGANTFRRMEWSIRSAADGSRLNSSSTNGSGSGGTRLIRAFQSLQLKLIARLNDLRKDLPLKLFFSLVGFFCATAFATVIGQTGDWDVLSAALAVAVVEGIGAIMYNASLPLVQKLRNLVVMFNYWKAGLTLGLFLDSFKY